MPLPFDSNPPPIAPVGEGVDRPPWSVMIPAFNCAQYLRQTLESVLAQDPGPSQMQIEVVDDCSTKDDPAAVAQEIGKGRVAFYRKPKNEGAIANFNTCIQRSRGHLVHILHGDDFVLPGFYEKIGAASKKHPGLALFACRSFYVDEEGVIGGITPRLRGLEEGGHDLIGLFYTTHIQTPSVVVRRSFYETHGGFVPAMVHSADCEMWARAIGSDGGWVMQDPLACYRSFAANDTGRLMRSAENLRDTDRMNQLFATRYPEFDGKKARLLLMGRALTQAERFFKMGDAEAGRANMDFWKKNVSTSHRLLYFLGKIAKGLLD